jgi:nucleotide-binding universal stress UspA family protein
MYDHILVGIDGSELAQTGLEHALTLAKRLESRVTIVTVSEPFPMTAASMVGGWVPPQVDYEQIADSQRVVAEQILSDAREAAEKMGVTADTIHVQNAWPAVAIVETAESNGCDLIVMASHGRRGIERALLGSQTAEVLILSKVPVLVIRHDRSDHARRQ